MDTDLAAHLALAGLAVLLVSATAASVPLDAAPDVSVPPPNVSDSPPDEPLDRSQVGVELPDVPYASLVAVAALTVGLAAAGYWLRQRDGVEALPRDNEPGADPPDLQPPADPDPEEPEPALTTVPPANEVYRAWNEMARRAVGPGDRSLSPTEVARRAEDRGLDAGAVRDLTGLFLAVRYGPAAATAEVERQARETAERLDGGVSPDESDGDGS